MSRSKLAKKALAVVRKAMKRASKKQRKALSRKFKKMGLGFGSFGSGRADSLFQMEGPYPSMS